MVKMQLGIFQANSDAGINSFNTGALQGIVSSTLRILKPPWICSFKKGVANSGFIAKACMPVIILRYEIGTERTVQFISRKKKENVELCTHLPKLLYRH